MISFGMCSLETWRRRRPKPAETIAQLLFTAVVTAVVVRQGLLVSAVVPDFATIWAAQHTSSPYSTEALQHVLGGSGRYVYPYPPTALVLTEPLRLGSYPASYVCWSMLSTCAVVLSLNATWAPLVLAAPAVIMSGLNGQTSLLMAALLLGAAKSPGRPLAAGLLYGIAACLKPQVGVLIPFLLLGARQWRTIAAAAGTVASIAAASLLLYGAKIWIDWATFLPTYLAAQDAALAYRYLSFPGEWRALPLAVGAAVAFVAGRRQDHLNGVFACVGAGLLGSLHAMDYDEAILAPFALTAALTGGWRDLPFLAPLVFWPSRLATLALSTLSGIAATGLWPPTLRNANDQSGRKARDCAG
jgi:hypothetical protein